jgi:hypothetical protein
MDTLQSNEQAQAPIRRGILGLVALYAVIYIILGVLGAGGGAFLAGILLIPLILLAPLYVITVAIISIYKHRKVIAEAKNQIPADEWQYAEHPAYWFNAKAQTRTFAHNFLLTAVGIISLVLYFLTPESSVDTDWPDIALWGVGTLAVAGSYYSIIINTGLIYNKQLRTVERYAYTSRTGAWKLILANRIWSWGIWITGGAFATFAVHGAGILY